MGKILCLLTCLLVWSASPAYAQKAADDFGVQAKKSPTQFSYIDIYKPGAGDVDLAKALLKNEIAKYKKTSGVEAVVYARTVQFQGNDAKTMLFAQLDGPGACAWRGCAVYVLVKNGPNAKWAFGLTTFASDIWIDTRKQSAAFPRVVTQAPKERPEYWLWDGRIYKGAVQ